MQFLDRQQRQAAQPSSAAPAPLEDRTNATTVEANAPPQKKPRRGRGRKSSQEEGDHRNMVIALAKGVVQDQKF